MGDRVGQHQPKALPPLEVSGAKALFGVPGYYRMPEWDSEDNSRVLFKAFSGS
jgi:hypothetical protein